MSQHFATLTIFSLVYVHETGGTFIKFSPFPPSGIVRGSVGGVCTNNFLFFLNFFEIAFV